MIEAGTARELGSLKTKLVYGIGAIAYGVKDQGFATFLLLFYNQVIGLSAELVGTAIMLGLVVDAVLDPLVGQFSDNLRTRIGRRHPLMYFAIVPAAGCYILLWNPPAWSPDALFYYLLGSVIAVRFCIILFELPNAALLNELTPDYDQRTSFLAFRYLFGWFGALGMTLLAFQVFLRPDATHAVGQLNRAGYPGYALAAAALMASAMLISAAGTHHHIKHLSLPPRRPFSAAATVREMAATLSHRSLLALLVSAVFFSVATGVLTTLGIYFNTYFWGLSGTQLSLLATTAVVAPVLAFAGALPISRRFGKRNAAMGLFALALLIGSVPMLLRLLGTGPANGSVYLLPELLGFQTITLTLSISVQILASAMMADVVEDSARRTGRRSEGLFFAMNSLIQKAVSGLGVFVAGLLLTLVHFPAHATPATLDPGIIRDLALVYLPTLLTLYGLSIVAVRFYRITRATHAENLRAIAGLSAPAPAERDGGKTVPVAAEAPAMPSAH